MNPIIASAVVSTVLDITLAPSLPLKDRPNNRGIGINNSHFLAAGRCEISCVDQGVADCAAGGLVGCSGLILQQDDFASSVIHVYPVGWGVDVHAVGLAQAKWVQLGVLAWRLKWFGEHWKGLKCGLSF